MLISQQQQPFVVSISSGVSLRAHAQAEEEARLRPVSGRFLGRFSRRRKALNTVRDVDKPAARRSIISMRRRFLFKYRYFAA